MKKVHAKQFSNSYTANINNHYSYGISEIEHIKSFVASEIGLELKPDFQRDLVWTDEMCSRYVEAILQERTINRNLYFNEPFIENGIQHPAYCVDGLQRMTALERFKNGEITAFGYYYHEIDGIRSIKYDVRVHLNKLTSYKDVLNWYIELNDTGVSHTEEDLNKVRNILNTL